MPFICETFAINKEFVSLGEKSPKLFSGSDCKVGEIQCKTYQNCTNTVPEFTMSKLCPNRRARPMPNLRND